MANENNILNESRVVTLIACDRSEFDELPKDPDTVYFVNEPSESELLPKLASAYLGNIQIRDTMFLEEYPGDVNSLYNNVLYVIAKSGSSYDLYVKINNEMKSLTSGTISGAYYDKDLGLLRFSANNEGESTSTLCYVPVVSKNEGQDTWSLPSTITFSQDNLPIASTSQKGIIKVGNNLSITEDGTLSAIGGSSYTQGNGILISNDTISIDDSVVAQKSDLTDYATKSYVDNKVSTKSKVSVSSSGSATNEVSYINIDGSEYKLSGSGGSGEPAAYIKDASVSGSKLILVKKDDSTVEFTDTTYSNKPAAEGGSEVSLVTTGDKYNWNNKISCTESQIISYGFTKDNATQSSAGLMSASDKSKLDRIPTEIWVGNPDGY